MILVTYDDGEYGYDVYVGIFTTREKAEYAARLFGLTGYMDVSYTDVEVDKLPEHPYGTIRYCVPIQNEGYKDNSVWGDSPCCGVETKEYPNCYSDDGKFVYVWAKDENDALVEARKFRETHLETA